MYGGAGRRAACRVCGRYSWPSGPGRALAFGGRPVGDDGPGDRASGPGRLELCGGEGSGDVAGPAGAGPAGGVGAEAAVGAGGVDAD